MSITLSGMSSLKSDTESLTLEKELKWIHLNNQPLAEESVSIKFKTKFLENPFVPVGFVATVAALSCGLYYFKNGDSRKQQLMMRFRVLAQGFTVAALGIGLIFVEFQKKVNNKKD